MKKYIIIMSIVIGLVGCKGNAGKSFRKDLLWNMLFSVEDNKPKQEGTVQSPDLPPKPTKARERV